MTNCYKCGAEIPGPNPECDDCAAGLTPDAIAEALDRCELREIDWAKVLTVEDFRLVLRHTFSRIAIPIDHPAIDVLKRFLKD